MALEKRLYAIPAQAFTANGTSDGVITLTSGACRFKVKQEVFLSAATLPNLDNIEVKRILSDTQLAVGPKGGNIDSRINISAYTTALSASISANEQKRPSIPNEEVVRAVFEEEPTVATRVIMVDSCGDKYGPGNPLPIAFDGTVNVGNVTVQDDDGDELEINPDGSINVSPIVTPLIVNISAPIANTEYSYTIPTNSKKILIRVRDGLAKMRLAFVLGDTTIKYISMSMGAIFTEDNMKTSPGFTVYFQTSKPDQVVEILSWT
jgi:hypothetical protein